MVNQYSHPEDSNLKNLHKTMEYNSEGKPNMRVGFGDTPASDAFNRFRTSTPHGIFENKNIHTKNDNDWEEPINGMIIVHGTVTTGPFQVGDIITGGTSGLTGVITAVGAGNITVTTIHHSFDIGETITGDVSTASAAITTTDTGSTVSYNIDESTVSLTVNDNDTEYAMRQTHRYHAYIPGKSHLILMTAVLGTATENVTKRMGYFDDNDGLFFEQTLADNAFVLRSSTSGSPVDTRISQDDWNIDTLDGNGPSGITLDSSKAQILVIDFQWLGVGRVRFGFDIDGMIVYGHEYVSTANTGILPYMATPTLPIRYEIRNTGATAGKTTMKEVCSSVASEGGYILPGYEHNASRGITPRTVTVRTPILAIRLKNEFPAGNDNRRTARYLDLGLFALTNDCLFELEHVHHPHGITATWSDVNGSSSMEYSTDITTVSGHPSHTIDEVIVPAAGGAKGSASSTITSQFTNNHSFISQNFDSTNSQMIVVYATALTGSSNAHCHLTWIEFD